MSSGIKAFVVVGLFCVLARPAVSLGAASVWQGKSADWNAAENWSSGSVPKGDEEIVIPSGLKLYPILTKDTVLNGSLRIQTGARLLAEGSLKIGAGKLRMEAGGELLLGVIRKDNEVMDAALRVTSPITPETCPEITPAPMPEMAPSVVRIIHNHIGPALPVDAKLANIAPFASIRVIPYMTMARTLTDRDEELRTVGIPEGGSPAKGVRYEFRYDKPQTIAEIRWAVVNGPWAIQADTNGDGKYDKLLRADFEGKLTNPGGVWSSRSWVHNTFWPPVEVYGIQIASLLKNVTDNRLYDVQLLSPSDKVAFAPPKPEEGVARIEAGEALQVADPPPEKQFLKGFHIEPWMFGLPQWIKMEKGKRPPLWEYDPFVKFAQSVKEYRGNVVNMWPPKTFLETRGKGTYEMDVLWPSQYDRWSLEENVLKAVCEAFHKHGIRIFTMLRCPYPKKPEEFPKTDTSDKEAPFISRHSREYLTGIVREQVASGVDGVGIGYDEQQSEGINSPSRASPFTRKAFEERYKLPFPERPADSEAFRKWIVFAYEEFASYLREAACAAKADNPKVFTKTATHVCLGTLWNRRIDVGIAEDITGHAAPVDFARAYCYEAYDNIGHYLTVAMTKQTVAANRMGGADSLHNCPWASDPVKQPGYYLDTTPAYMYGPPIASIMHGGRLPMYWRHNYIFYGGYDKYVKQAYSILDTLAAWGAREAKTPRSIAVLRSRASEDWWQVRQRYSEKGNPVDQTRGFLYLKWLLEFLLTNGHPFDMYYLDYPEDFAKELASYDLLIFPFPYSIKKETFDLIGKEKGNDAKVLVLDRKGETDEWGNPHGQPLFAAPIAAGEVKFVDDDVPALAYDPRFMEKMRTLVDGLLGDHKPIHVDRYGHDVDVSCLERSEREKIVTVINWAAYPVEIDLGVRLPGLPGGYRVLQRDLDAVREIGLSGRKVLQSSDLRRFRVPLGKWEVRVFHVAPAK